jgi:uncharacterized Zn-finger protein
MMAAQPEAEWNHGWDDMFPSSNRLQEEFEVGSEDEVADGSHIALNLHSNKVSNGRLRALDEDILFSPDHESESSRGPEEEQGTENSNSAKGHECKDGEVDTSLHESHTSFEFATSDHYGHHFSLSPFTRVNFNFDMHEEHHPVPYPHMKDNNIKVHDDDLLRDYLHKPSAKPKAGAQYVNRRKTSEKSKLRSSKSTTEEVLEAVVVQQRKFQCRSCKAMFSRQSHLDRHNLSHTGERPFVCVFEGCTKAFTRKEHLKRHVENTHGNSRSPSHQPIICLVCSHQFKDQQTLKKHLKAKHSE